MATTTTYYGDKIKYSNTLVQSGGASTYPIIGLSNTRLGDNGFKVLGTTGFIRKVVQTIGTTNDTVWKTVSANKSVFTGGHITASNRNSSYKVVIDAKAVSGSPYLEVILSGYEDSCNPLYLRQMTQTVSTTPQTFTITNSYDDQYTNWDIGVYVYGGTVDIYRLTITIYSDANQSGSSKTLCDYGAPYNAGGGYTTIWKSVSQNGLIYSGGGIRADAYNKSYRVIMNAKAISGTPYLCVKFNGWYDSCDDYSSSKNSVNFSTTPKTVEVLDTYKDQDFCWDMYIYAYGGSIAIYYLNIVIYRDSNQTGSSAVLCSYGSPYIEPATTTNTYYV